MGRPKTAGDVADIIERFLNGKSCYPQEWNDFVEGGHPDPELEKYRKRCDQLDPLINIPGPRDPVAVAELRAIVTELRQRKV